MVEGTQVTLKLVAAARVVLPASLDEDRDVRLGHIAARHLIAHGVGHVKGLVVVTVARIDVTAPHRAPELARCWWH